MKGNVEKSIKRWLKNKVKVTLGLMVSFLITGNIGYSQNFDTISSDVTLIEDSTAVQIKKNKESEVTIGGNYKLTIDGENKKSGTAIEFSRLNLNIEGEVDIKNFVGGYLVNTMANVGGDVNFRGGLNIFDSGAASAAIRTQNSNVSASFMNMNNLIFNDSADPHAGVISGLLNSEFYINRNDNIKNSGVLSISNIKYNNLKTQNFARGIFLYGSRVNADSIYINNIESLGKEELHGINAQDFSDGISYIKSNNILIENLNGNGDQTVGILLEGAYLQSQDTGVENNVLINNISSSKDKASVYGLYLTKAPDYEDPNSHKPNLNVDGELRISNIIANNGEAYGSKFETVEQAKINNLVIDSIEGENKVEGIILNSNSNVDINNLNIQNLNLHDNEIGIITALNVEKSNINISNAIIDARDKDEYNTPTNIEQEFINSIAVRSVEGSNVNLMNENGEYKINGSIVAGSGGKDEVGTNYRGGKINISGKVTQIEGDIFAGNGGEINIVLNNNSYIKGQIDDYYELNGIKQGVTFHNSSFVDNNGNSLEVTKAGTITLDINDGAKWVAIGQNYLTNLENDGIVDMTQTANSAITVHNLSGYGTVKMRLNSVDKNKSDMLYVSGNISGNQTIEVDWANEEGISAIRNGERLRFATTQNYEDSTEISTQALRAYTNEEGIFNIEYMTEITDYDSENEKVENLMYNGSGDGKGSYKPGDEFATEVFSENGLNHYIIGIEKETINDAGKTIIEMSKANYASAVYLDNLNKRLGDMTFAEGKEGFWVRLRNDRVGEDGEYRLHNYMTQLGYDKPYPMEEGKGTEYRGIAFEISKGDMDYKNINGDANVDRQALWLYDTNMYNNGFYSDYVFRAGRMESEFDIYGRETGVKVEGTYKNLFVGASAEYGYRYDLSEKTYLEPQVQLQYTYIDGTDYTTNQETKVELDEIHSVIGRAGARLGHDFYNKEGNKTATLYAKADINHEFLGDQRVKAKDKTGVIDKKYENDATWYDIGIGASKDVTPDFNVYMDVERQIGRTRDDQSWQFNLGFRYRFNDVKDLNPVVMLRDFTMKADNYFDFDKSELKPEGKKVVKEISNELTKENATGTLKIEGHTDSIGTKEYNQKLSERRAQSVENEFKQNITTDKIKYETRGYGEERPIADNATKEGRAKNRRVEINFGGTIEN